MAVRLPDGGFVDPFGGSRRLAAKLLDTPLEPEVVLLRRPAADAARGAVRRAARRRARGRGSSTRCARCAGGSRSCRRSGSATSSTSCWSREHARRGSRAARRHGARRRVPARAPGAAARAGPGPPAQGRAAPHLRRGRAVRAATPCCGSRRCCTTSASRRRGRSRRRACSSTITRSWARGWRGAAARASLPERVIDDVRTLVELHLRFHGYGDGLDRHRGAPYVRDAGPLLDRLNQLTRADCTTRNEKRAEAFAELQDELEERIARARRAGEPRGDAARRWTAAQVMEQLGLEPGPQVGEALAYLMDLRLERGPIPEDEAFALLRAWAAERCSDRRWIRAARKIIVERLGVAPPVRRTTSRRPVSPDTGARARRPPRRRAGPSTGRNSGSRSIGETSHTTPIASTIFGPRGHARIAQQVLEQQDQVGQEQREFLRGHLRPLTIKRQIPRRRRSPRRR